jgi:hypothetical protein
LSYRGTAQRIYFHSNTEREIKLLRVWGPTWGQHPDYFELFDEMLTCAD